MTELEYLQAAMSRLRQGQRATVTLTQRDLETLESAKKPEHEPLPLNDPTYADATDDDGIIYWGKLK